MSKNVVYYYYCNKDKEVFVWEKLSEDKKTKSGLLYTYKLVYSTTERGGRYAEYLMSEDEVKKRSYISYKELDAQNEEELAKEIQELWLDII